MNYEQLSLFSNIIEEKTAANKQVLEYADAKRTSLSISERITDEFDILQIPFIGCDFDVLYPQIARILPPEKIQFDKFGFEKSIACELVCASICHQMNWDILRQAVFNKTQNNITWVNGENLSNITALDIDEMLRDYNRPERIRAEERAKLLQEVGEMVCKAGNYRNIFLDNNMNVLSYKEIRGRLLACTTFSQDPGEKKLQLLLQKLSNLKPLRSLRSYYKPAVDYHLIRCYLRRGLLFPKTQYAESFISNPSIQRKESTVGAVRKLCSEVMEQICWFTSLDTSTVNLIEWHIGRSICTQKNPDCFLDSNDASWLRTCFSRCPFYDSCIACQYKKNYLTIQEPTYGGTSY